MDPLCGTAARRGDFRFAQKCSSVSAAPSERRFAGPESGATARSAPDANAMSLSNTAQPASLAAATPPPRRAMRWRALLGLALPLGCALLWEAAVRLGLAQGRLIPPPSRIAETL